MSERKMLPWEKVNSGGLGGGSGKKKKVQNVHRN
jgi:hypothetical protein